MNRQQVFIKVNKTTENKKSEICLEFSGTKINNNANDSEAKILLENIFSNPLFSYDVVDVITSVRTILKDYKELFLSLKLDTKNNQYIIEYNNGKIIKYTLKNKKSNISYKLEEDFKFSIYLAKKDANFDYTEVRKTIDSEIKNISELEKIKPLQVMHNDKVLIKLYELFYNQKTDFSSLDINEKIQSMMYILEKYGISLTGGKSDFRILNKKLTSIYYLNMIKRLMPIANTSINTNNVYLSIEDIKKIEIIKKEIFNYLEQYSEENRWKIFRKMCAIDYVKRYVLPSRATNKEVANHEYINSRVEEVEKTLNLINEIK